MIVARLNGEIDKSLADPATRESLLQTANEPIGGSAEQFSRLVAKIRQNSHGSCATSILK
jgi:hypothetical protein